VVAMMAIPAIFLYLGNLRKQVQFFVAAGLVVLIGWSPFPFQDPQAIFNNVFGYPRYYAH
jgi:hypothetical protein